jgi:Branched-chain amino acid transport system / permease component
VIIASSDDDEILGLADRVIVLNRGRVVASASGPDLTPSWLSYHVHTSAAPAAAESEMSSRGALTQDRSAPRRTSSGVSESLRSKSTGRWLAYTERYALVILVFALVCLFSVMPSTSQTFLTLANLQGLALTQSVIALAAIAATIPLVAGQFDVSVGPVLGMTSVVLAAATVRYQLPVPLSIMISVLTGGAVGAINGYIVAYLRTSSFIITLGTGTLITGLVTLGTSNQTITDAPQSLVDFGSRSALGIPWLGWVLCTVTDQVILISLELLLVFSSSDSLSTDSLWRVLQTGCSRSSTAPVLSLRLSCRACSRGSLTNVRRRVTLPNDKLISTTGTAAFMSAT